jgi:predicted aconitase
MILTDEQKAVLEGTCGAFPAKCLKWLIDWGEAMGAQHLVPVENAMPAYLSAPCHTLKGASRTQTEEYLQFITDFCGHPVKCIATSHIARFDFDDPELMDAGLDQVAAQRKLIDLALNAGITLTWTCTPYLTGNIPQKGQICAWTESHAVVYINSFLGARTTRHSGETALAAAITGFVPAFGAVLDEGRGADLLIDVRVEPRSDLDWGVLGYFAGKHANIRTPAFRGLRPCRIEAAKQLCAGVATTGGSTMLHIIGVTPEAPSEKAVFGDGEPTEVHVFGPKEREAVRETFAGTPDQPVDVVYFGCPHASLQEIVEIAQLIRGKRIQPGLQLFVCTNYGLKAYARRLGFAQLIEEAGGKFMVDTCPLQAPYLDRFRAWKCLATNAVKQAHYARAILGCQAILGTTEECIRAAVSGRWA